MSFFKRKEKACCSVESLDGASIEKMNKKKDVPGIKILGTGCKKCQNLEASTREALQALGLEEEVTHVDDVVEIATYGVMSTPALVIDNKVVSYGKSLSKEEIIEFIKKYRGL